MSTVAYAPSFDLFTAAERSAAERLAASPLGGLLPGEAVVDLFAGAGGWDQGAGEAGLPCHAAINHDEVAIGCHEKNHPACLHFRGDAWRVKPADVMRQIRERFGLTGLGVLLASAACTTHSPARGAAPISKRVHMLGWCIARWMKAELPRIVFIENVTAWKDWGPTVAKRDKRGRVVVDGQGREVRVQDPRRKGSEYRRWMRYIRALGYVVEQQNIEAVDHGSPSRRHRLFLVCRRDGAPIVWPEVTHGGVQDLRKEGRHDARRSHFPEAGHVGVQGRGRLDVDGGMGLPQLTGGSEGRGAVAPSGQALAPYRCAADIIDFSDLGRSIYDGKRTKKSWGGTRLARKTVGRLCEGVARHVIEAAAKGVQPFSLRVTHGEGRGWHVSPLEAPLATQTTRQDLAIGTPVLSKQYEYPGNAGHDVREPIGTVTTIDHHGVATPVLAGAGGSGYAGKPRPVGVPLNTVKTDSRIGVGTPIVAALAHGDKAGEQQPAKRRTRSVQEPIGAIHAGGNNFGVATPVMIAQRNNATGSDARDPITTLCSGSVHNCVVVPVMQVHRGNAVGGSPVDPLATITAGNGPGRGAGAGHAQGMVSPIVSAYYEAGTGGGPVDGSLGTVVTKDRHGLGSPVMLAGPMAPGMRARAIKLGKLLKRVLGDRVRLNAEGMALVVIEGVELVLVDILFRMLRPRELAAAMGFPAWYWFPACQRDAVRLIGNAVHVAVARALVGASLPRLRPVVGERRAVA